MLNVKVIIGIIGSGKSTLARQCKLDDPQSVIINNDAIRQMLRGGEYKFVESLEPVVKDIAHKGILSALQNGNNVIVDECHIARKKRQEVVDLVRSQLNKMQCRIEFIELDRGYWCLERRLKENRGVDEKKWTSVFLDMMRNFEDVFADEGYDQYMNVNTKPTPMIPDELAFKDQQDYCNHVSLPMLVPSLNCPKCKRPIFQHPQINSSMTHITSCPWCGDSFCD